MKKLKFCIILSLIFFMVSCQKDNEIKFYDLGSEFFISNSGFTSLDNKAVFSIENQQNNLTTITMINLGGVLANGDSFTSTYTGTIAIADSVGSITLTDANMGITAVGETADFQYDAVIDGKPFSRYSSIAVKSPVTLAYPTVTHRVDTTFYLTFKIKPIFATVGTVKVQTKVSEQGTYVDVPGTFVAIDSVAIVGGDYAIGDTLFVKVIGTVGTKTASKVAGVVIESNSVPELENFTIDMENLAFDFIEVAHVGTTTDSADIEFTGSYSTGGLIVGFASNFNAEFVMGTASDYSNADKLTIESTNYSASITSNDNLMGDEVYFFRTKRNNGEYFYGIMKISVVDKPQGDLENSFIEIEYKY